MTTHIPSLTLPGQVFAQPATSILLPIALGAGIGFFIRRTYTLVRTSDTFANACNTTAKETQNTYMALKQPPYRPPPQIFGPMWTALYGLMGYSAYRAWNTGMASLNPNTVALTKVRILTACSLQDKEADLIANISKVQHSIPSSSLST